jgi:hypothetical protein
MYHRRTLRQLASAFSSPQMPGDRCRQLLAAPITVLLVSLAASPADALTKKEVAENACFANFDTCVGSCGTENPGNFSWDLCITICNNDLDACVKKASETPLTLTPGTLPPTTRPLQRSPGTLQQR